MDTKGRIHFVADEQIARQRGLIPVTRVLTPREVARKQIERYSPCGCGSGKKFKFCCGRRS